MRLRSSLVAVGLAAAITLTGCAAGGGGDAPESGDGASLTIAKPDGPITTEGNNPWVGDSSALRLGYANAIFEPLGIVNLVDPTADVVPWLASEITWSEDYTSVQLTARDGVTWNDGEDFTADDIAYTFQMIMDNPALDTTALGLTDVAVDGDTVTLSFENPMFIKQDKVLHKLIVPKHVWEDVDDPTTFTNEDPVGTGPYTLSNFSTQAVELTARDDYWGGELAVPTLYYVSYADNTALTTALANGDADWAQAFIPNVQSAYLDKDPDHNVYWAAAGLGIDTMFVNTTTKPFDDVAFRQAVNMVIDRTKHQEIAREGGVPELTSVTGLPTPAGDAYIAPEFEGQDYAVDVDGAKKVLEDAGYTWDGDTLIDPDGEAVTFTLTVPQGWNDYVTGISLISDSVKELGVEAAVDTPDADSWWAAKGEGDFQAILHWTDSGATPYDLYSDQMDGRFRKPWERPPTSTSVASTTPRPRRRWPSTPAPPTTRPAPPRSRRSRRSSSSRCPRCRSARGRSSASTTPAASSAGPVRTTRTSPPIRRSPPRCTSSPSSSPRTESDRCRGWAGPTGPAPARVPRTPFEHKP